ncbi:MAG: enoyl-CoA hydratase-related protein [Thermodesulfobacteriota bacterium]
MSVILVEKREKNAIVTLNRPESYNALSYEAWKEITDAWIELKNDPEVYTIILTGSGDKAFCVGQDLKQMARLKAEAEKVGRPFVSPLLEVTPTKYLEMPKPVIAAINGFAIGAGLELALACDIRIAAEHAQLGLREVTQAIIPGAGGTQRLPRLIPFGLALEILMTGDLVSDQEAYRIGLVNKVVPFAQLMPTTLALANRINENGPLAVRAAKEAAYKGIQMPLNEALRFETLLLSKVRQSEDAWEGPNAFAEKRKAIYKGK